MSKLTEDLHKYMKITNPHNLMAIAVGKGASDVPFLVWHSEHPGRGYRPAQWVVYMIGGKTHREGKRRDLSGNQTFDMFGGLNPLEGWSSLNLGEKREHVLGEAQEFVARYWGHYEWQKITFARQASYVPKEAYDIVMVELDRRKNKKI